MLCIGVFDFFFARYFLTRPSFFKVFPTVRSCIWSLSFSSCQWILRAHFLVSFLTSITRSLSPIPVSFGLVLGAVDLGMRPSFPCLRYDANHHLRMRSEWGQTLTTSVIRISLFIMGRTHPSLSSWMLFAMRILINW